MKILIVEDEPQTARMLKTILQKLMQNIVFMDAADSITSTVSLLKFETVPPDLIFMDIQLADGHSFEIFNQIQVQSPVIFCTAYDQFMLEAFKSNGIDYLLKPVREEDVAGALEKHKKLKSTFADNNDVMEILRRTIQAQQPTYKQTLLVQYRENFIPLSTSEIALFYVENEILYAYTFGQQKYAIFRPLSEMETELNPETFFRISRQALINKKAILEIQPYFNRKVSIHTSLQLTETLVVSRLKVAEFMMWMEK